MNILQASTSDPRLISALNHNLYALFQAMSTHLPNGELFEDEHICYHRNFPLNPMFNGVWRTRLSDTETPQVIADTIQWFKSRGVPLFFWWIDHESTPSNLSAHLKNAGLMSMDETSEELMPGILSTESGAPVMTADLQRMNVAVLKQVPPHFEIRPVTNEVELQAFKSVFVAGYEVPEWAGQAWVDATLAIGIGRTPWQMYVGWLDGKPVATNMLFNGGGIASVYGVATLAEARGVGIGGAITLLPLLEARDMGYRYASLFASEMGIHAYERIGFRLTRSRINRYLWRDTL